MQLLHTDFQQKMAQLAAKEASIDSDMCIYTQFIERHRSLAHTLDLKITETKSKSNALQKEIDSLKAQVNAIRMVVAPNEVLETTQQKLHAREAEIMVKRATIEEIQKSLGNTMSMHKDLLVQSSMCLRDIVLPSAESLNDAEWFVNTRTPNVLTALNNLSHLDQSRENTALALLNHRLGLHTAESQLNEELQLRQKGLFKALPALKHYLHSKEEEAKSFTRDWDRTRAELLAVYHLELQREGELSFHVHRGTHRKALLRVGPTGEMLGLGMYPKDSEEKEEEMNCLHRMTWNLSVYAEKVTKEMRQKLEEKEKVLQLECQYNRRLGEALEVKRIQMVQIQQEISVHDSQSPEKSKQIAGVPSPEKKPQQTQNNSQQ